jgi:hypothetical protein
MSDSSAGEDTGRRRELPRATGSYPERRNGTAGSLLHLSSSSPHDNGGCDWCRYSGADGWCRVSGPWELQCYG